MPYFEHTLGKTWYQIRGSRRTTGLPIVCLHGGPGGHSRFMTDVFRLSDDRRILIYDQIGGGRSSKTGKKHWTISTFVRELEQLTDHLGLERFHLFGASWGTTLALEYFRKKKNRSKIASLIFQSPMFSAADWQRDANRLIEQLPTETRKVIRYCHEIGATDSKVYQEAMNDYYARHVCRNKEKLRRSAKVSNPNGNKIYEYMWGASEFSATGTLRNYDQVDALAAIDRPTLFICGEYDEARPVTSRKYTKQVKGAEFIEISNASHAILSEKPAQLLKTIRPFIANHDGR